MAVDYLKVDAIAAAVADIYDEAEQALLALLTRQLAAGGFDDDTSSWAARKLGEVRALQRAARLLVDELERDGNVAVRRAVADGWRSGRDTALVDLAEEHVGDVGPAARIADVRAGKAVQALADACVEELRPVHSAVLRSSIDAYRDAVGGATARKLAGTRTTRQAAQDAWAGLVRKGITAFTDKSGRTWRLHSYVEMATRAAVARAAIVGETDAILAAGLTHCYVEDNPRECPICEVWERQILSLGDEIVPPARATLAQAQAAGLHHPNCFPGEVLVSAPTGVRASDARRYEGDLVVVHTAVGQELPVTPNHPILTPEGWVAAGSLKVGDHVLRYGPDIERMGGGVAAAGATGGGPDDQQVPAPIGEVHRSRMQSRAMSTICVPGATEQFHGDGGQSEVQVVLSDGFLAGGILAELGQRLHDGPLVVGGTGLRPLFPECTTAEIRIGARHAPHGGVGRGDLRGPLLAGHVGPLAPLGVTAVGEVAASGQPRTDRALAPADAGADFGLRHSVQVQPDGLVDPGGVALRGDAGRAQAFVENDSADADSGRDLARRLAGQVTTGHVVKVERRAFVGHVYNLQAGDGWFVAGGIVVSNCRHRIRLWRPGTRIVAARKPEGPEGYEAEQHQRYLERQLRHWRERHATAFDDAGRGAAARKIAEWSAKLAEHLDAHPRLPRLSYRERPGAGYEAPRNARTTRDAAHLAGPR